MLFAAGCGGLSCEPAGQSGL